MWFSLLLGAVLSFGTFGACALLTVIFGDICWPPRVGAILIGFSVFLQGLVFSNPNRFSRKLKSGITLQQRILHVSYVATIFGTLFGAFGDLFPNFYGVTVCAVL